MTINFSCEICGKTLSTSDDKAGRKAKCPGCGEMLIVPNPDGTSPNDLPGDEATSPATSSRSEKIPCPMCGEDVPATAKVCEFCGEPLTPIKGQGHAIIETGDVISSAWNCFKAEMGMSIGIIIVGGLVNIAGQLPQQILNIIATMTAQQGDQQTAMILQMVSLLFLPVAYAVQFYMNCGQAIALLKIARGEATQIGDLFTGGRFFWRSVGASIVFGLMAFLGFILCLIPGIIVTLMFAPFMYVLVDEDSPGIDCLWRAKTITEGNKLSLFVIGLACLGINLLGLMAACIGLIFTAPLTAVIFAVAYCKMTAQRTAG